MNFKDLQPIIGDLEKRLRYELERVTSVCEFETKLSTNEIDYYNNTILHLETVIEKAIFYLKTNEIKSAHEFKVIKRRLKNLNKKLFELRAEAEDNNVKLNIELLEFNEDLILEFLPENPTYLDNYKEIEQEIREHIRPEPPKAFPDYTEVGILFAQGFIKEGKGSKCYYKNKEFPSPKDLYKHLQNELKNKCSKATVRYCITDTLGRGKRSLFKSLKRMELTIDRCEYEDINITQSFKDIYNNLLRESV